MKNPLISIIIPCHNAKKYISTLLDSILIQEYNNVEIFAINDGSTDQTVEILQSYKNKFKERNYQFVYYEQKNQGVATTINTGLKLINGKYLLWPDPDDWYENNTVFTKLVKGMEENPDCYCARVLAFYVDENSHTKKKITPSNISKKDLFYDFLDWNTNIWAPAGSHMISTSALFNQLENKNIFTNKDGGQNYQLLLPILYNNKCYTIQEYLYNILVRKGSHSRGAYSTYKNEISRWKASSELVTTIIQSIKGIKSQEAKDICRKIKKKYIKYMMNTAKHHKKPLSFIKYFILSNFK